MQFIRLGKEEEASSGTDSPRQQQEQIHAAAVTCVSWSAAHVKLASGDAEGTIIVWSLKGGKWAQEMVNKRFDTTGLPCRCPKLSKFT